MQLEGYEDNAYVLIKKWAKGQNDNAKMIMKYSFFGGGGQRTPDYKNKYGKNVFGDVTKVNLLVDLYFQTVRIAVSAFYLYLTKTMQLQTTAVDPTEENRVKDLRKLVESLVKFSAFHRSVLSARPNRLKCDASFWEEFHSRSHDQHCDFLESKGTSVFAMAFALHLILTGVGLYVAKQDADVIIHDTTLFKGSLAIQELVLLLLVAGQDNDQSHYKKEGLVWAYAHQGGLAQRVVRVPGVCLSQLHNKNQDALRYVHPILKHVKDDERPVRCKALTSKGAFKDKVYPTDFLFAPAFLDGWPTPLQEEGPSAITVGSGQRSRPYEYAEEEAGDETNPSEVDDSLA